MYSDIKIEQSIILLKSKLYYKFEYQDQIKLHII